MKINLVRIAALAALTVSASAAFASPIIPAPLPTAKGFADNNFSPIIPAPLPTAKGFSAANDFSPIIPAPLPTAKG